MEQPPESIPDTVEEVLQEDDARLVVDVKHDGPILTHELPTRYATSEVYSVPIVSGGGKKLLTADPRRKSAQIISLDFDMLVSFTGKSGLSASTSGRWKQNVPLPITFKGEVWVASADFAGSGNTNVTVVAEYWAD